MKLSLQVKVILLISALTAVMILGAVGVGVSFVQKERERDLATRADLTASIQLPTLSQALWNFDMEAAQSILEGLRRDPDFHSASVVNAKGDVNLQIAAEEADLDVGIVAVVREIVHEEGGEKETLATLTFNLSKARLERGQQVLIVSGLVAFLVLLGAILGCVLFALRMLTGPLSELTRSMLMLANGDHDIELPARERGDEIGAMAGAVQVFKDNAIRMEELQKEQAAAERRAEEEKRLAMTELADTFEANVKGVVDSVSSAAAEMQATAQAMSATAEQTSRQGTTVASASEQATANVQTVATATEELSSSIAEISRQVGESANISQGAVAEAERTNNTIQGLAQAAQKIGEVVDLINDIASQTDLLALNATIEAARAGEAGKGFAVVASEVKNLANQTARATDEIATQIGAMQEATDGAVTATEGIGKIIANVNEIAASIASAVEQQQAATTEISRNVQEAAHGTQEVSSNIGGVDKAAADTGAAAGQMQGAAGDLSKQSEALRAAVETFLGDIKAA